MARRLAERGVRFIQLYHRGWDHHAGLPRGITTESNWSTRFAGLIQDLKQRGLLDDTLVIWGGEFGRTVYCQGKLTADNYGRDHHGRCFTMWLAGGGVRSGMTYGASDEYGYNVATDPVSIHDVNATIIPRRRPYAADFKCPGRDFRLTDVHGGPESCGALTLPTVAVARGRRDCEIPDGFAGSVLIRGGSRLCVDSTCPYRRCTGGLSEGVRISAVRFKSGGQRS